MLNRYRQIKENKTQMKLPTRGVPQFYAGEFILPNTASLPLDTFLRLDGWRKGIAILNGFNLGRYWPVACPQVTLYAPAHLFKPNPQTNTLVVFEQEGSPLTDNAPLANNKVQFVKEHVLNGTTPHKDGTP